MLFEKHATNKHTQNTVKKVITQNIGNFELNDAIMFLNYINTLHKK